MAEATTMHLLTLRFSDPEIEQSFLVERFVLTHGALVIVSCVCIGLHSLCVLAVPSLLAILAPGTSFFVLLLGLRLYVRRYADLRVAHRFFTNGLIFAAMVATVQLGIVIYVGATRVSPVVMMSVPALYIVTFVSFRLIAVDPRSRLFIIGFISFTWLLVAALGGLGMSPDLDGYFEWKVINCHLIVGEAMGYIFDRHVRCRFIEKHQAQAGRDGPEPVSGEMELLPSDKGLLDTLSLHFYDEATEQRYRHQVFRESFNLLSLSSWLLFFFGACQLRSPLPLAAGLLLLLLLRIALHIMPHQQFAYRIHVAALVACRLSIPAYILLDPTMLRLPPDELLHPGYVLAMVVMPSLYARISAMPNRLRLALEGVLVVFAWCGEPITSLGQPLEAIFVTMALLVIELLGFSIELQRRLAHANEVKQASKLAAAERRAAEMEEEARRLRLELTSVLSADNGGGAALTAAQLDNLLGPTEISQGLLLSDLSLEKRVGTGSFATVYRARYRGAFVALKQPHSRCTESDLVRFVREVQTLRSLSHPHIVRFIGAVWEPSLMLVLEWMEGGSVHAALATAATSGAPRPFSSEQVALDVARGMAHLHSLGQCHRDLKAANVLLDGSEPPVAKVADFGLSRSLYAVGSLSRVGTPLWTAPEVARQDGTNYTLSCDVYSYAIFLLELEVFQLVHAELAPSQRTCSKMLSGWRPPSTVLRGVGLLWLIHACWAQEEDDRPAFRQIVKLLSSARTSAGK